MEDIKKKIKDLRKSLSLSQEQLAKALGISFSTVSRWETGQSKPNDTQLEQIEALQDLLENKEIDLEKLRKALLAVGVTGAIFAAVAIGLPLTGVIGGMFTGFLTKSTGSKAGNPISGKDLSKILKKNNVEKDGG